MAEVTSVSLDMGRIGGTNREFANVGFNVRFSQGEVRMDLDYEIHIAIFEQDEGLDDIILIPNGFRGVGVFWTELGRPPRLRQIRHGDQDEFIFYRKSGVFGLDNFTISPSGNTSHTLSRRLEFDVGDQERGNEEYRAFVWIVPEITIGHNMSDQLSVNLG